MQTQIPLELLDKLGAPKQQQFLSLFQNWHTEATLPCDLLLPFIWRWKRLGGLYPNSWIPFPRGEHNDFIQKLINASDQVLPVLGFIGNVVEHLQGKERLHTAKLCILYTWKKEKALFFGYLITKILSCRHFSLFANCVFIFQKYYQHNCPFLSLKKKISKSSIILWKDTLTKQQKTVSSHQFDSFKKGLFSILWNRNEDNNYLVVTRSTSHFYWKALC